MISNINQNRWWSDLKVIKEPIPHVPESHILMVMPEEIKREWENWMRGQTGLACENGDFGVYSSDWARFVGKLERGLKLEDKIEEWAKNKD